MSVLYAIGGIVVLCATFYAGFNSGAKMMSKLIVKAVGPHEALRIAEKIKPHAT